MFSYQPTISTETRPCTSQDFAKLIVSESVCRLIAHIRRLRAEGKDRGADLSKRQLPLICYCANFVQTPALSDSKDGHRKKGDMGRWRVQAGARLTGLYMLDVDHVDNPEALFNSWWQPVMGQLAEDGACHQAGEAMSKWAAGLGIVLVHKTSSNHGLRIVGMADVLRGNLFDNATWLASQLGVTADEACKDASRGSFCPEFNDILFINNDKLFNYENPAFDEKYGPQYRGGCPLPTRSAGAERQPAAAGSAGSGASANCQAAKAAGAAAKADGGEEASRVKDGYHGVSYEQIITQWFALVSKGEPKVGDRHRTLLRLAGDLRYICDNQAPVVEAAMKEHPVGRDYAQEDAGAADLTRIAADACSRQMYQRIPKRFLPVLEAAGVKLAADGDDAAADAPPALDYAAYAQRLLPLLSDSPGLREAVSQLPDNLKLGGVLAAGAMLGTYLTRTWWEHFDGKLYRLSFLTYIVGAAASGKSFLTEMDRLLMAPLQSADRIGREAERQYKEKTKRRKANEQLPDQPHPVIRYCPSTTSNAILYRRLQDAVDKNVVDPTTDEPLHLHLITVESELATALRSQVGSWAGKADLELKSFHNEKAGVDYANTESTNGIMQINWNQVISGTQESMSRKVTPKNVLDGLVTRLALFLMPSNDYVMLERKTYVRDHERDCMLRSLGYKLEEVSGLLYVPRLVDYCYHYEEQLTRQARIEQDECLDYFRKRIPVIMMRYTLVRIVLRQLDAAKRGEDLVVEDSDLEFARLIGDWCLECQMHMFGQMVMDALQREREAFTPRKYQTKTREAFNKLDETFTLQDIVQAGLAKNEKSASITAMRWKTDALVEAKDSKTFKKKVSRI